MDILSSIQIDPQRWPFAVMVFLRIVTLFFFLPVFGDQSVPIRIRIALGITLTFFVYPIVSTFLTQKDNLLQWNGISLVIATIREVIFGFAIGFSAKLIYYGVSIASQIVGVNMGFQTASMFNPTLNSHESSYTAFKNWILVMLIFGFNVHHYFLENIIKSFTNVPIGPTANVSSFAHIGIHMVQESFILGLRLAAPLITVQILINISMGLLNRALPSLNVFVISFPLSFIVTMVILLVSISSYVALVSSYGFEKEVAWLETMRRAFSNH